MNINLALTESTTQELQTELRRRADSYALGKCPYCDQPANTKPECSQPEQHMTNRDLLHDIRPVLD